MSLFLPNIPQPNDNLDFSQGQLLSNNQGLDAVFTIDHTLFSDSTGNKGFHKKVTLYQVALDPAQAFPGAMLYTKNSGIAPNRLTDLFFSSKPETGADVIRQLTGNLVNHGGNQFTVVTPWGIIYKFGQATASSAGIAIVFPTAFPTAGLGVLLSPQHAGALSTATTGITTTGFTAWLQAGPGTQTIYYFAWGN